MTETFLLVLIALLIVFLVFDGRSREVLSVVIAILVVVLLLRVLGVL